MTDGPPRDVTLCWLERGRAVGLERGKDGGVRWLDADRDDPTSESLLSVPFAQGLWALDLLDLVLGDALLVIGTLPIARVVFVAASVAGMRPCRWQPQLDTAGARVSFDAPRRPRAFVVADDAPGTLRAILASLRRGDSVLVANAEPASVDLVPYRDLLSTGARVVGLPEALSDWPLESYAAEPWIKRADKILERIPQRMLENVVARVGTTAAADPLLKRGLLVLAG